MDMRRRKLLAVLAVALVLWFLPIPEGLTPAAWHIFAIFAATILGFIFQPIAIGAMGFIGVTVAALTGTISISVHTSCRSSIRRTPSPAPCS